MLWHSSVPPLLILDGVAGNLHDFGGKVPSWVNGKVSKSLRRPILYFVLLPEVQPSLTTPAWSRPSPKMGVERISVGGLTRALKAMGFPCGSTCRCTRPAGAEAP